MRKLDYVVTGTGRCGTVYMAKLLTASGIPCGHETIFGHQGLDQAKERCATNCPLELSLVSTHALSENGCFIRQPDWLKDVDSIVADSSYMAAPFLQDDLLANTKTIHVVRNPSEVVDSFVNHIKYFQKNEAQNDYEQLIYRQLPELTRSMSPYGRAALYCVLWNQMIEKSQPECLHRVEDNESLLENFLGVPVIAVGRKENSIRYQHPEDTFNAYKIESSEIRIRFLELISKYEYSAPSLML